MLLPTTAKLSLVTTPRTSPARTFAAPPAPAQQSSEVSDLSSEIKRLMEQDLDYLILRKSFALDTHNADTRFGQSAASGRSAFLDAQISNSAMSTANANLQASLTQASTTRFELSLTRSDSHLAFETRQSQSSQLDLHLGNAPAVQTADPLVLDLSGLGITTTGVDSGVEFDLTGDGQTEQVSFVTGDSWFVALDRNQNGRIDDGSELFGDQGGAANGFAALSGYDSQPDGVIDANDTVFSQLRLFQIGSDGKQVVRSFADAGITAIELGYQNTRKALNVYDSVAQTSQFQRADGSTGEASDVLLGYRSLA